MAKDFSPKAKGEAPHENPEVPGPRWKRRFGSPVYLISVLFTVIILVIGLAFYQAEERR